MYFHLCELSGSIDLCYVAILEYVRLRRASSLSSSLILI